MERAVVSDLTIGAVFAGRYRVERRIAAGGMGAVYEVVHIETKRRRALKVMHAHYVQSDELRERFRQEAQVAAEIESEHIVDVFDAGIDEPTGMPFLVMELLRGEELGKRVKRVGALPKEDVVQYLYETSLALDKTHRARIVHRDLKPDNLFLCERERGPARVKVLDFGIAKIVSDASTQANATRSLGTPLYMAPEQFLMMSAVSGATDIFALGMIAFTLLVGKPYWYRESKAAGEVLAFAMHVAQGPRESAVTRAREQFGVQLPKVFDLWFFRATARDPSARFATASDAVIALADVLGVASPEDSPDSKHIAAVTPPAVLEPEADPTTILLPSVNQSSPMGPTHMMSTQMEMTPKLEIEMAPTARPPRMNSLVLVSMCVMLVVGLGAWFVVKPFVGSSAPARVEPPGQVAVAASAVSSESVSAPVAPVVASAETNPLVEPSVPSASPKPEGSNSSAPEKPAPKPVPKFRTAEEPRPWWAKRPNY
ncbi:MAG TPA: serine/threonine-protein kinase [Polyangium sp.]|nr:serine/threonine-protein kinase [Polyangium sp.]